MIARLAYLTREEKNDHKLRQEGLKSLKEIGETDFVNRFFHRSFTYIEDCWLEIDGQQRRAQLFYEQAQDGLAMVAIRDKVHYYRFGCHHELALVANLGRCYNRYRCTKCDRTFDIDSGD